MLLYFRIRFSEKNDARYYVPDSYLTDEEEVRVRSDDVNENVHFTWPYQKILSSTSMPTIPLVVEETEDEAQQQSVDWSARWGDEEDNSSDVLPSIPSSTTPSPQSSFSAADESEMEANADEGDKSNILIKMEEDEEIIVESGKNDRKPIDNESESDESSASEELAIVADSEPISFTHDGGCIIQQQQVENLASVKTDSPTIGNDDETKAEESGNGDLKGMERQHEIPAVAQSPAIIDAQFEEFELGSVISSSSDSDNSATMDTDNDSLTMAAEAVEEAKLKMEEDKSNSIATEMTKQWIPLESVVVVGSVAAGNALAFEGSDQTSAAAVGTLLQQTFHFCLLFTGIDIGQI